MEETTTQSALATTKDVIGKPYKDLEYVLNLFREVLIENGEEELAEFIPWIGNRELIKPEEFSQKHVQLYSIGFQILNMVEENWAVQTRRHMENENSLAAINGLWGRNLKMLKENGIPPEQIAEMLPEIRVEPVLTAHPTEAKRSTVLEHHRSLYLLLVKRENQMYTAIEQREIGREIKIVLNRLWRTGEIFVEKPDVASERNNVLHYLTNVFPEVIPILDRRLGQAWEELGFDPELIKASDRLPKLSFGNWVGGDRDGHPFVTADVTKETLEIFRLNAFVIVRRQLLKLVKNLSFTCSIDELEGSLQQRMSDIIIELGDEGEECINRNKGEAFRQFVSLMMAKLPIEVEREHAVGIKEGHASYTHPGQLISDLKKLRDALVLKGAGTIAYNDVKEVIRIVETFGFHLAHLDIRQNSNFHEKAIAQLMNAAALDGDQFLKWNEEERVNFLNKELQSARPFTHPKKELDHEADAAVSCYRVLANHIDRNGTSGIGALIVSMTRSFSDLLIVYVLAREAGLVEQTSEGLACSLPVVPLFETIEDLQQSPEILKDFIEHPFTRRSLEYQQKLHQYKMPIQQVMIGYSDSNKDGGILASQWNLYYAQSRLAELGRERGVKIRFFHGKGGSISRGAGPTQWFIKTLPFNSIGGDMRLTEQGETISQKYANKINATYNLELLTACTAGVTILHQYSSRSSDAFEKTLQHMAEESQKHYLDLIHHKHFIEFFSQATPIDAIESSKIGSRPSRRTGKRDLEDLRAIPWVFSWNQSRFNLTSWYGVGYVLEHYYENYPQKFKQLQENVQQDSLMRYIISNVDTSLAATDEKIIKAYAELVENKEVKETILNKILTELEKSRRMVELAFGSPFQKRRKQHFYSNVLRAEALDDLHYHQIALLKKWRKFKEDNPESQEANDILLQLLLTINGIASALRNTG